MLGSREATIAFQAVQALARRPQLLPELKRKLQADTGDVRQLAPLIADLASADAATREQAATRLKAGGPIAQMALRDVWEFGDSATAEQAESILKQLAKQSVAASGQADAQRLLQIRRAVWAIRYMNSSESQQALGELAQGATYSPVTLAAKACLRPGTAD